MFFFFVFVAAIFSLYDTTKRNTFSIFDQWNPLRESFIIFIAKNKVLNLNFHGYP